MAETATAEKSTDTTILTEEKPAEKTAEQKIYPTEADKAAADAALKATQESEKAVADKAAQEKAKADAEAADKLKTQEKTKAEDKPPTEEEKAAAEKARLDTQKEYTLTPPAGSLVSAEEAKALTDRAKKAGLSKEQAEAVLQERNDAKQAFAQAQTVQLESARKQWAEESKNDPVFGGDKFAEHAEKARRVVNRFASNELKKMLDETGMGNHPEVFKFIATIAGAFSEDQLVRGQTGPTDAKKSPEEILYGKTTPSKAS